MHQSFEHSVYASYRLLDVDRIDDCDPQAGVDPSRLRTACLMIYAGLLLSLSAIVFSFPAAAQPGDCLIVQSRGLVADLERQTGPSTTCESSGFARIAKPEGRHRRDGSLVVSPRLMHYPDFHPITIFVAAENGTLRPPTGNAPYPLP